MSICLQDFYPINTWNMDQNGSKWPSGEPKHLIDQTTGRKYWNESKGCVRVKCILLTTATPFVHIITLIGLVVCKIFKIISFYHFWCRKEGTQFYNTTDRFCNASKDVLKIFLVPLIFFALELSALYGILNPYDGRKIYASTERIMYGSHMLAPCFQPSPKYHAFGGDPNKRNAF